MSEAIPVPMNEGYPKSWVKLIAMVSPAGEVNAIGGDREPGDGDMPYPGLDLLNNRIDAIHAARNAAVEALAIAERQRDELLAALREAKSQHHCDEYGCATCDRWRVLIASIEHEKEKQ